MVNIRFHLVSLVAVFFALAIGIGVGSSVVRSGVLEQTQSQLDSLDNTLGKRNREIAKLRAENDVSKAVERAIEAKLLDRSLSGISVLVVTLPSVTNNELRHLTAFLSKSDANVLGVVEFSARVRLGAAVDSRFAAIDLQSYSTKPTAVRNRLRALSSSAVRAGRDQVSALRLLTAGGFATVSDAEGRRVDDLTVVPETRIVIVGTADNDVKDGQPFAVPFLRAVSQQNPKRVVVMDAAAPVVRNLAKPKLENDSLVAVLRERKNANIRSSTIDGSLSSAGVDGRVRRVALTLTLRHGYADSTRHFGTSESALSLFPSA